jgi:uncharacterized RDD family membrane protein YckC
MDSIDILTGQNVTIQYQTATILQRIGARLLDYFFIFAFLLSSLSFLGYVIPSFFNSTRWLILIVLIVLPAFGYHFIFESIMGGKTPGKNPQFRRS